MIGAIDPRLGWPAPAARLGPALRPERPDEAARTSAGPSELTRSRSPDERETEGASPVTVSPAIGRTTRRPSRPRIWLLRLQYWFDRLSEPQRLLAGLACIAFLGACWLYLLGISSTLLLNQAEQEPADDALALSQAPAVAEQPATLAPLVLPPTLAPEPTRPPTATPAVERGDRLIEPPSVPEVPVVAVPRGALPAPAATLKPRAVAPPAEVIQAAPEPTRAPTRSVVVAPPAATSVPVQASPVPVVPAAQPTLPAPRVQPTVPVRVVPTPTRPPVAPPTSVPTRAIIAPPVAPPVGPGSNGPVVPPLVQTPTTRRTGP
jgi:hypothetical protein